MRQLIVNAIGPDRPGIVGRFTGHLHMAGANVLDSRMVNLRGQFAIILLIEASDESIDRIRQTLPRLAEEMDLQLILTEVHAPAVMVSGLPFKIKTYSLDQPGIVDRISNALREFGVNIEELAAKQESAPFAGMPLFLMEMRITVPIGVSLGTIRGRLQGICEELNCDIDLEPA